MISPTPIKIHYPHGGWRPILRKATSGAAAYDVHLPHDVPLPPNEITKVPLGFRVELPSGWEMQIRPRSGLAFLGITVVNSPGTVDSDYRGEVAVLLRSQDGFTVDANRAICQLVFTQVPEVELLVADDLSSTQRADGGFGSTDTPKTPSEGTASPDPVD